MANNTDPNQTSLILETGFRPQSVPVDSSRIDVRRETSFDFQNAIAIPSRGILADFATWLSFSSLVFRLPIQSVLSGYVGVALWVYLSVLLFIGILFCWILINAKTPIDGFYRLGIIFGGFCIASQVAWYI